MEQDTLIIRKVKNQTYYPIELNYNFCSCMIFISSKIFNATYNVSINYDHEECDIKCLSYLKTKDKFDIYIEYDSYENKINLYCEENCPENIIFTIKIIY
jgi:hypothetical protein